MAKKHGKNTRALIQMLNGKHKSQQKKTSITFHDVERVREKNKKREVGEVWYETDPVTGFRTKWTQHKGYRSKSSDQAEALRESRNKIKSFYNCPKEECTCKVRTHLDDKFQKLNGMCSDCSIKADTRRKVDGTYAEYERKRQMTNAKSFLEDARRDVEILIAALNTTEFALQNGDMETWSMPNKEAYIQKIKDDFAELEKNILSRFSEEAE